MFVRKILSVSQSYSDHKEKKVKIVPTWNEFQFLICHLYFADAQNPGVQGLKTDTEPSAGHKHLKVILFLQTQWRSENKPISAENANEL